MTDKEKARAFDEAIRKAQDISHTSEFIRITDLFPQLAESEDERIRKVLISYFEWVKERDCKSEWNGLKVDDIRAWLENQKKQKSVQCIEFANEFEKQVSHLLASVLNGEWEYNEGFVKHAAQSLLGYAKNEIKSGELDKIERLMKALQTTNAQIGELVEENYKLKEQKSDSYSEERKLNHEWTSEDWSMLCDICGYIKGTGSSSGITNQERVAWLRELPKRFSLEDKEQKPAEWSGVTINGEPISIENKSVDIPLIEWSEEDEENINTLIEVVHERIGLSEKRKQYYEKWLKSLLHKPHTVSTKDATKFGNLEYERGVKDGIQSEKSHQWKPSDEQLRPLEYAIDYFKKKRNDTTYLESLYNDLKKL